MASMTYGEIPGVTKPVSRIAQGATFCSLKSEEAQASSLALLDACYELGCNFYDTSSIYGGGDCDRVLGLWMEQRGIRDKIVIQGKCCHHSRDRKRVTPWDITADLHDCLARFRSDYVDLWLMHRDDPSQPVGPLVETMNEHLAAGRIHAWGGSNWSVERVAEANEYAAAHGLVGFAVSSPNFSLGERVRSPWGDSTCIGGPQHQADRAWYAEQGMALVPWSSLAAGFFSGKYTRQSLAAMGADHNDNTVTWFYNEANTTRLDRCEELAAETGATVAQIALAYLLCGPCNVFPLVGCQSGPEMQASIDAVAIELSEADVAYLELASDQR